ncbi:MAG: PAS domain-containing sensor histidine kinase, partial [Gammaproteobacteria bacterium]
IETINRAAEKMFGYRTDEIVGRNVSMLMPEPFRHEHDRYLANYLETGEARIIGKGREAVGLRRDGSTFPLDLSIGEIRDANSPRFVGIMRDITARKGVEKALRLERDRAQGYLDLAAVILLGLDLDGRIRLINKRGCELLGYEEPELLGRNWFENCLREDDRAPISRMFDKLVRGEMELPEISENWVVTRAGGRRMISWKNSVIRNESGEIIGTLSSGEDVTDRRRTAEQLRQRDEQLELVFENAPLGTFTMDLDFRLQSANSALSRMVGSPAKSLAGKSLLDLVHTDQRRGLRSRLDTMVAGEQTTMSWQTRLVPVDDRELLVRLNVGVVHDASKRPLFLIGQVEDLTERIHSGREARQLRERLTQVARLSTMGEMAASLAHEINQPLTAIATYAQAGKRLLDSGRADESDISNTLEQIGQQAQRAGEVIRSLRRFLRQKKSSREKLDVNEVIREVAFLADVDARAHDVELDLGLQRDLPAVVADAVQIQQVILNLIRNALDATRELGIVEPITINSRLRPDNKIEISVEDAGPGVSDDMRDRVFTPFQTSKAEGMGMGLSISRSIISAHGGTLNFENRPGTGARFYFTLPTSVLG